LKLNELNIIVLLLYNLKFIFLDSYSIFWISQYPQLFFSSFLPILPIL